MTIAPNATIASVDFDGIKMFKGYAVEAESGDAYAITVWPVPNVYTAGYVNVFKASSANTGSCTLNVNSLRAKTIKKLSGLDLQNNDILAGQTITVVYDGTNFQLQNTPITMTVGQ